MRHCSSAIPILLFSGKGILTLAISHTSSWTVMRKEDLRDAYHSDPSLNLLVRRVVSIRDESDFGLDRDPPQVKMKGGENLINKYKVQITLHCGLHLHLALCELITTRGGWHLMFLWDPLSICVSRYPACEMELNPKKRAIAGPLSRQRRFVPAGVCAPLTFCSVGNDRFRGGTKRRN